MRYFDNNNNKGILYCKRWIYLNQTKLNKYLSNSLHSVLQESCDFDRGVSEQRQI